MLVNGSPSWQGTPIDPPNGGGDNTDMEARISKIEAIIPTLATREDVFRLESKMHQEFNTQTWKFITWMTGVCTVLGTSLVGATYFIAHNVK